VKEVVRRLQDQCSLLSKCSFSKLIYCISRIHRV